MGNHDAQLRRIIAPVAVLSEPVSPDLKTIGVKVRNQGDHTETIGVYLDVIAPGATAGDPDGPGDCLPYGRILSTTVVVAPTVTVDVFADTGTLGDSLVEFSCANQAAVVGMRYTLIAAVDAHADDEFPFCAPGLLLTLACANALADDDIDPADNRLTRNAPRVQPVPSP